MKELLFRISLLFSCIFANSLNAQTTSFFRLDPFMPSINYERSISKTMTFNTALVLLPNIGYGTKEIKDGKIEDIGTVYYIIPSLNVLTRKYFNLQKRIDRGASIAYNSGNYILGGLQVSDRNGWYSYKTVYKPDNLIDRMLFGLTAGWGMQRMIFKRWQFDASIAGKYIMNINNMGVYANIRIGYIFPTSKKENHE